VNRCLLCKEQVGTIQRQITVYLVCRNLVVAHVAESAARVHHRHCPDNVGLQKDTGVFDATVNMAFGSEVDDHIRLFLFKEGEYAFTVTDIQFTELEVRVIYDGSQGAQVSRVGKLIYSHHPVFRMLFR